MMLLQLIERYEPLFFVLFLSGLIGFFHIGLRLGRARRYRIGDEVDEGASLVVGSILGLLAFVLALNLSSATARQDSRLNAGLEEVNAIGTAVMQAKAVGGAQGAEMAALLGEYLQLRYRFVRAAPHSAEIAEVTAHTNQLQSEIWALLQLRIAEAPTPAVTSLMNALNGAFDSSTAMQWMMSYRIPAQLIALLVLMSLLGTGTVGFQFGLNGRKGQMAALILSALWGLIVVVIIDIGSGRIWTIRTDTRVYEWALTGMGLAIPDGLAGVSVQP